MVAKELVRTGHTVAFGATTGCGRNMSENDDIHDELYEVVYTMSMWSTSTVGLGLCLYCGTYTAKDRGGFRQYTYHFLLVRQIEFEF